MNQSQLYIFVSSKLLRRRQPERGTGRATLMNAHKIVTFAGNSPREMIISSILGAIQYTGARHFRIQSDTLPRSVHAYLCMLKWARTWKCELQFYANDLPRRFGNRHPRTRNVNRALYGRPKQMLSAKRISRGKMDLCNNMLGLLSHIPVGSFPLYRNCLFILIVMAVAYGTGGTTPRGDRKMRGSAIREFEFLWTFPLGEKVLLKQFVEFVISNTCYNTQAGLLFCCCFFFLF